MCDSTSTGCFFSSSKKVPPKNKKKNDECLNLELKKRFINLSCFNIYACCRWLIGQNCFFFFKKISGSICGCFWFILESKSDQTSSQKRILSQSFFVRYRFLWFHFMWCSSSDMNIWWMNNPNFSHCGCLRLHGIFFFFFGFWSSIDIYISSFL